MAHRLLLPFCFLSVCLVLSCAAAGDSFQFDESMADDAPIKIKTPPATKEGSQTVEGCNGVTQRGTCTDGVAMYCDLERAAVRKSDCGAQGRECVVDSGRGAICRQLSEPATEVGFCVDNIAVFKDPATGIPHAVDCSDDNLTCHMNACRDGAYCCAGDGGEPSTGDGSFGDCQGYDLEGSCVGEVATYCLNGVLQKDDCSGSGQSCQTDECALGAYCCGGSSVSSECQQLGLAGVCEAGRVRYCENGDVVEFGCTGSSSCQKDTCYNGAACCE